MIDSAGQPVPPGAAHRLQDRWWDAARHADRRPRLLARNRIKRALRQRFEADGFTEVECAALVQSPGNETHLHAFSTDRIDDAGERHRLYLHTSPEFAMKKLIAAGETRIFEFARVWRNREVTRSHSPEFTMLEWYRVGGGLDDLIADCAAMLRLAAQAAGVTEFRHRGVVVDPFAEPEILTVADGFTRYAGIDLLSTVAPDGTTDRARLAAAATAAGIKLAADDTWSDIFSRVLAEKVEPAIGRGRATVLTGYPIPEAALARPSPADGRVAERFELFACGLELANAFGELTDGAEQRRRFEADMDLKEKLYGERYPIDDELIAAIEVMPDTSGIALGFDRLVMLATHTDRIHDVLWVPVVG